jgi:ABC-type Fe3+-hydroxamate transport system substrate-binding protein
MKAKFLVGSLALVLLAIPLAGHATEVIKKGPVSEAKLQWELINPEGVVMVEPLKLAPRIATLEGKTVVLYWNGKSNGDNFLNEVAKLLVKNVKGVKVIKAYEVAPETADMDRRGTPSISAQQAKTIAAFKPDIVISSQGD